MRLLSVRDLSLHEFNDSDKIPPYAILSHTWGKDEVTLDDIKNDSSKHKAAYAKIQNSCRLAANDGLQFVWIDTCCINKSSSAELSEAINSMFKWYEHSKMYVVRSLQQLRSTRITADMDRFRLDVTLT
jgi:Heterokaryon incompatibility protein (HET)